MKTKMGFLLLMIFMASCVTRNTEYRQRTQNPEFLHRSLKAVTDRIVYDIFSPPVASRIYAYTSIAAYEALVPMDSIHYQSLAGQVGGLPAVPRPNAGQEYCFPLAAVQASLRVGRALVFSEDKLDEFSEKILLDFRETQMPEDVYDRSIVYGTLVADHILAWASKDNYKQTRSFPKYSIERNPATWKPTPPAYMDAVEPHWNKIRPFVIDSASQFAPERPTPFATTKGSKFYEEAFLVYQTGKNLTEEQRAIASFWDCNPYVMNVKGHVMFATKKISPGGHWMNITRVICRQQKQDILQSSEAYVRVALSLIDGFISCWDEKYRSKLIRPESYINQYIDENWIPLLQTPPFPEYTSGHSVISSAASTALTGLFGDTLAFTDSTEVEYGMPPRAFTSFRKAAEEAAISRMYGGIHYMPACDNGKVQGQKIGKLIINKVKTRRAQ